MAPLQKQTEATVEIRRNIFAGRRGRQTVLPRETSDSWYLKALEEFCYQCFLTSIYMQVLYRVALLRIIQKERNFCWYWWHRRSSFPRSHSERLMSLFLLCVASSDEAPPLDSGWQDRLDRQPITLNAMKHTQLPKNFDPVSPQFWA